MREQLIKGGETYEKVDHFSNVRAQAQHVHDVFAE